MKLKFTLRRPGAPDADLLATVDAGATVGDLAAHLLLADPRGRGAARPGEAPTLRLFGDRDRTLDPALKLAESGVHSGMTAAVTLARDAYDARRGDVVAVVLVTAGPDTGREFVLQSRTVVIGRDRSCEVRLTDPLVSRQHARLTVGGAAEIVDLGSANGVEFGGEQTTRASLRSGDTIRIGDTDLVVRIPSGAPVERDRAAEGFIRSPLVEPVYAGTARSAPEPPQRPAPSRLPLVALAMPMVLGAVLYFVTRSTSSLVFVALGPLMMVGYTVESTLGNRSAFRKALRVFRDDLLALDAEATAAATAEAAARHREHPGLAACVEAIRHGMPLLWSRRPDGPGFAELRLGTGSRPARDTIEPPTARHLPRDLMAEVHELIARHATVAGVPIVAGLAEDGAVGVAGPPEARLAAGRALVLQLAALHSPAELVLCAFASSASAHQWHWLTWLPHTTSPHSPLPVRHLASGADTGALALASAIEDLLAARRSGAAPALPAVVVLVTDDTPVERSRLVGLAEEGGPHGVHVLWLAADAARLPAACRTFVELTAGGHDGAGSAYAGFAHTGERVDPVAVELLDEATAAELARRLAPRVDVGARVDDDSDLPRSVPLLAVAERALRPEPGIIVERWQANRSILAGPCAPPEPAKQAGTLRAVLGRSVLGPYALDLRTDGPHALVGGTTGAGKSELLQSWILALAAAHSPQRLTFLLIDYKGGSAFKDLRDLPHKVGLVTDLDPHEVRRAHVSLGAELRRRERLFAKHGVKDLVELEKKGIADAPPSLVIVVDEFAALVTELPEFVDGMINVAQRGRSLGVHLILATQRPAGVIKDNLRANTNLRIALRTADESDSVDVLGSPQAAYFDSAVPGRAVSKTGPGRLVPFQTAYAGGWTRDEPDPPEILVEELGFGARPAWEPPERDDAPVDLGRTDIQRLVEALEGARVQAQIRRPAQPWLPPLQEVYDLSDPAAVPGSPTDAVLVFGIRDAPDDQAQPTVAFRPDVDGNLAVYGTGGSGKSTLLRTIAIAAGSTSVQGAPCHVYGLDFGARGLDMLEPLPHVGAVLAGGEHERIARLIDRLTREVAERAERFARAGAGTITEYRAAPGGRPDEARILLLVDGVTAFRQAYETGERARLFDAFCAIAVDGRPVGIHVLLTADRPAAVPSQLASAVQTRVVLRMADANEYHSMSLPADVLKPTSKPGRGLLGGAEVQVAILGRHVDVGNQAAELRRFAQALARAGVAAAPRVAEVPKEVPLEALPPAVDGLPVLGVATAGLTVQRFAPEGVFLVVGAPGSGRTAGLRAIAGALRRWDPAIRLYCLSPQRRSRLAAQSCWTERATGSDDVNRLAKQLADELPARPDGRRAAVFLESVVELAGMAETPLSDLLKICRDEDVFVVAENESSALTSSFGVLGQVRAGRYGLAFAPDLNDGDRFRTPFPPRLNRADFPPGRAMFVRGGTTTVVQVGWAEEEPGR
ncbi:FtsK/SpoIIIE domain-containing protein [Dactylosporangium sp. CA-139066]|uniref:FtsK/SpoIIIE domain-containing protein n=1 Tax=Dactylosporangium sp. CA-139066 TaxID=3239930 RepID=UPI003D8C91AF